MDEFGVIRELLAPLASGFSGSLRLTDDAALLTAPAGCELAITKDAIVEGVHFTGTEPPEQIAQKLLRVNLSDLAAMGAEPLCYFLALMLPNSADRRWFEAFTTGLAEDQKRFGIALAGGDTTRTPGLLCLSLTAFGIVPAGRALRRNGAQAGDAVYVSGTIGDAALGLQLAQSSLHCTQQQEKEYLLARYHLPQPRLALGSALRGLASAAIDISDGLVADLGHICEASNVGAVVYADTIPLSPAARMLVESDARLWNTILTGGDDYELCFTVPAAHIAAVEALTSALALPLTRIGEITSGSGVQVVDEDGQPMAFPKPGYTHF